MTEDFGVKVPQYLQTLAVQQRDGGPRLETPQRLNAVALLQVQQLYQDNRVDLQQAAVSWTSSTGSDGRSSGSTSSSSSSSTTMWRAKAWDGSSCRRNHRSWFTCVWTLEFSIIDLYFYHDCYRLKGLHKVIVTQFLGDNVTVMSISNKIWIQIKCFY